MPQITLRNDMSTSLQHEDFDVPVPIILKEVRFSQNGNNRCAFSLRDSESPRVDVDVASANNLAKRNDLPNVFLGVSSSVETERWILDPPIPILNKLGIDSISGGTPVTLFWFEYEDLPPVTAELIRDLKQKIFQLQPPQSAVREGSAYDTDVDDDLQPGSAGFQVRRRNLHQVVVDH